VVLQREWTANAEFAGDLLASGYAAEKGWNLEVAEGSEVRDPVQEVLSGRAQFGVASADRILRENESGANLTILAVATRRSPVVFVAAEALGLQNPRDMLGHSVGIQTGTNTEFVFEALVMKSGINRSDIRVVESGWGVGEFVAGQIEILAVFDYDEPIELERRGMTVSKLIPSDFGVDFVGTVYFSRRSLVMEDPELVQSFLDVLVAGWTEAIADPDKAMASLFSAYPNLDEEKERRSFLIGQDYFSGDNGISLYAEPSRWRSMGDALVSLDVIKEFTFPGAVDYRFLRRAQEESNGSEGS
jgi:ABC-type nitrate/sulfonate/bicarbonate transport system substrate-binding protein